MRTNISSEIKSQRIVLFRAKSIVGDRQHARSVFRFFRITLSPIGWESDCKTNGGRGDTFELPYATPNARKGFRKRSIKREPFWIFVYRRDLETRTWLNATD